jgi:cytochrome c553
VSAFFPASRFCLQAVPESVPERQPTHRQIEMNTTYDPAYVPVDRARFLTLTHAAGTTVRCVHGWLWITRDGHLEDIDLTSGQSYVVEDGARVVVSAFEPSQAHVQRPSHTLSRRAPGLVGAARHRLRMLMAVVLGLLAFNVSADPKAGEAKAQLCLLCHKAERAGVPLLEAQPAKYLVAATMAFKQGRRSDQQMQANVARLSPRDVADIADYFASRGPIAGHPAADAERVALGERRVSELQCANCHLSTLGGRDLVPRLAGQASGYLVSQLEAFATGRRAHPAAQMPANETREIESIASYLATLR